MPKRTSTEPIYKPVHDHQRIAIPGNFCEAASISANAGSVEVCLWLVSFGRYRILAGEHAKHPDIEDLRKKIVDSEGSTEATEFVSDAETVQGVRLIETRLTAGKEWRLVLPDIVMDVLKIRKEGQAVVVLDGIFVEVWAVETFESALRRRISN